ncbi:tubulin-specific chaperone c, putative [Paecilomyces variotii No. 5]|uniref:Tubulin-specific chaperone c, putative n=1 Tax=Byssochlamys spectabilis (strain No. 5 / NBRC 109023) TaxID=1356009 RepID=V5GBL8_BYSSN|nr:tubulin-specific chaperone c, putative [Paecilomyces variotii No. 5]
MSQEIPEQRRPSQAENQILSKSDISLKERFFRYFQHEITALQEQMGRLADTSLVAGERSDAADHCLAGIARLSNEVKDASSYIPTQAIKALRDKLTETKASVAPRQKFAFKRKKNPSAVSLADAAEIAAQGRRHIPGYRSPGGSSPDSSANPTPNYPSTPLYEPAQQQMRPEVVPAASPAFEGGPTFSAASSVTVDNHYGLHIMLPASASSATVPASITSLRHCVVDMSIPTANEKPYASLTAKNVKESLLICGQVNGPAHITDVENSVILVSCHQFRMHDCRDVDVYLSCSSNPIIEDCKGIRFARIPKLKPSVNSRFLQALDQNQPEASDNWNQVEDFKWIKLEPSPNWSLLDPNDAVPEEVWAEMVPGGPCWSLEDILRATKVLRE